jgi:predicted RNA binding protein YcfA (HicA-like mRNA interferase family)
MPKIRHLSGKDVVRILETLGFILSRQKGSHIILKRKIANGEQIILVPNHSEIDRGTLNSIYKKMLIYVDEDKIKKYFYTE